MIILRRRKIRDLKLAEIRYKCATAVDFETQNLYIENNIENLMTHFA